MNREVHVRFWEGLGVRFPRATQQASASKRAANVDAAVFVFAVNAEA